MRYWPLSEVAASPVLHHAYVWELICIEHHGSISEHAMAACHQAAGGLKPVGASMVLIHSAGAPMRRAYTAYPSETDWLSLERLMFFDTGDAFGLNADALH